MNIQLHCIHFSGYCITLNQDTASFDTNDDIVCYFLNLSTSQWNSIVIVSFFQLHNNDYNDDQLLAYNLNFNNLTSIFKFNNVIHVIDLFRLWSSSLENRVTAGKIYSVITYGGVDIFTFCTVMMYNDGLLTGLLSQIFTDN